MSDIRREDISSLSKSFYVNMAVNLETLVNHSELLKHVREN